MNDYRGIFALLSLAAGLVLFIAAIRYAFSKQASLIRRKRVFTSLTYSVLFVIVGVLLWSRQGEHVPTTQEVSPQVEQRVAPQPTTAQPATPPETKAAIRDTTGAAHSGAEGSPPVASNQATVPPIVHSPWERAIPNPQPIEEKPLPAADMKAGSSKDPEERIASAVNHAFAAIERFFDKYGSPAPKREVRHAAQMAKAGANNIKFPRVTFEEQSADLTTESQMGLRRLAKDLTQSPDVNLEIQARVDSVGPEALNYMLTQARAAAVRDFLVVEGVPAERLIARGFGTQPFPHGTNNLIAFVVRR